ncbi:MAG: chalcone isomerase family protein [Ardenticatenaceae bacterium]
MNRLSRVLLLAGGLALAATSTLAATCEEVEFPDRVTVGGGALVLNGLGLRKATIFNVRVYVAGLYLPSKSSESGPIIGDGGPWRLVLRFLRDVDAEDLHEALQEGFEKIGADRAQLQPRIENLKGLLGGIEEGQSLGFTAEPGAGVTVDLDDAAKGAIAGADFAAALLAIWIGPSPPNDELKSGLLGGACE